MPKAVASILENCKWNSINKINKIIEQLESLQDNMGVNVEGVLSDIQDQVDIVANQKDTSINKLISEFKLKEASEELHSLTLIANLKCMAHFKAKGMPDFLFSLHISLEK
jgi:division protein CdvB (Snf7/Vps24/ESCRT-III family)